MRRFAALLMTVCLGVATGAAAEPGPVVVELYTSQGCSSCPPADDLFRRLVDKPGVIALSLHVDYWDYIGWKDNLADPAYTRRQKTYAKAAGHRTVYTPQMVIGGRDHVIGTKPMEVMELLQAHATTRAQAALSLERQGQALTITAQTSGRFDTPLDVQLVRYSAHETVDIKRGENAGRTLTYHNVVRAWDKIATWDGRTDLTLKVPNAGDLGLAVLLQEPKGGPIVAAAQLR